LLSVLVLCELTRRYPARFIINIQGAALVVPSSLPTLIQVSRGGISRAIEPSSGGADLLCCMLCSVT